MRLERAANVLVTAKQAATSKHKRTTNPAAASHPNEERPLHETAPPLGFVSPRRLSGADSTGGGPSPSRGVSKETFEKENGSPPAANALTEAGSSAGRAGSAGRGHAV